MTERFGVTKCSRRSTTHSYEGISWQYIGVTDPPPYFDTLDEAEHFAELLSSVNPVGFVAFKFDYGEETTRT